MVASRRGADRNRLRSRRRGRQSWIELGPYGYLPTDPARLTDEVARRGLSVSAGTVFTGLHRGPSFWESTWAHVSEVAALTQTMGARHLVVIPTATRCRSGPPSSAG
jgi:inosose dehydratase